MIKFLQSLISSDESKVNSIFILSLLGMVLGGYLLYADSYGEANVKAELYATFMFSFLLSIIGLVFQHIKDKS